MILKVAFVIAIATYAGYEFLIRPKLSALKPGAEPVRSDSDQPWPNRQNVL
jgi:hypothetical protein